MHPSLCATCNLATELHSCKQCGRVGIAKHVGNHSQTAHGVPRPNGTALTLVEADKLFAAAPTSYSCNFCEARFSTAGAAYKHIKQEHKHLHEIAVGKHCRVHGDKYTRLGFCRKCMQKNRRGLWECRQCNTSPITEYGPREHIKNEEHCILEMVMDTVCECGHERPDTDHIHEHVPRFTCPLPNSYESELEGCTKAIYKAHRDSRQRSYTGHQAMREPQCDVQRAGSRCEVCGVEHLSGQYSTFSI